MEMGRLVRVKLRRKDCSEGRPRPPAPLEQSRRPKPPAAPGSKAVVAVVAVRIGGIGVVVIGVPHSELVVVPLRRYGRRGYWHWNWCRVPKGVPAVPIVVPIAIAPSVMATIDFVMFATTMLV